MRRSLRRQRHIARHRHTVAPKPLRQNGRIHPGQSRQRAQIGQIGIQPPLGHHRLKPGPPLKPDPRRPGLQGQRHGRHAPLIGGAELGQRQVQRHRLPLRLTAHHHLQRALVIGQPRLQIDAGQLHPPPRRMIDIADAAIADHPKVQRERRVRRRHIRRCRATLRTAEHPIPGALFAALDQDLGSRQFQPGDAHLAPEQRIGIDPDRQRIRHQHRPFLGPVGVGDFDPPHLHPQHGPERGRNAALNRQLPPGDLLELRHRQRRHPIRRDQHQRRRTDHHQHRQNPKHPENPAHPAPHLMSTAGYARPRPRRKRRPIHRRINSPPRAWTGTAPPSHAPPACRPSAATPGPAGPDPPAPSRPSA